MMIDDPWTNVSSTMSEFLNASPFVIKVKKTNGDNWHIENKAEISEMQGSIKHEINDDVDEGLPPGSVFPPFDTDNQAVEASTPSATENYDNSQLDVKPVIKQTQQNDRNDFAETEVHSSNVSICTNVDTENDENRKAISIAIIKPSQQIIPNVVEEIETPVSENDKQTSDVENGEVTEPFIKKENMDVVVPANYCAAPKRLYKCISCSFSSLNLLGFLVHVQETHFINNNSSSTNKSASLPHSVAQDKCLNNQSEIMVDVDDNKLEEMVAQTSDKVKELNFMVANNLSDDTVEIASIIPRPLNDETENTTMTNITDSNHISNDAISMDYLHDTTSPSMRENTHTDPTVGEPKPFVNIALSADLESCNNDDGLPQLESKSSSTGEAVTESKTFVQKKNDQSPNRSTSTSPKEGSQNGSRGAKINSIINNLKEGTALVTKHCSGQSQSTTQERNQECVAPMNNIGDCNNSLNLTDPCSSHKFPTFTNNSRISNVFPEYNTNMDGRTPNALVLNHSMPRQNSQTLTKCQSCDVGAGIGFPRQKHSGGGHFEDLQSLLASGCVTMPNAAVLQSIKCSQDTWNHIQEMLHEAFSAFPYLTQQESRSLAEITGLTVKQINTLFVVARLQHGISWEQYEIDSARSSLSSIAKNRFQTYAQSQPPAHNNLPTASTQEYVMPKAFSNFTKEQHDILRWSFTSIPLTTNELDRLHEVTTLEKSIILQYLKQLHLMLPQTDAKNNLGIKRTHPDSRQLLNNESTIESIQKLKRSTNHANNYFEKSRANINNGGET